MAKYEQKRFNLTSEQKQKLLRLSQVSGYSQNEIIRMYIDNLDEVNIGNVKSIDDERRSEIDKFVKADDELAPEIYQWNYLMKRLGNNVNQLAKWCNKNHKLPDNFFDVMNQFIHQQNEINKKVGDIFEYRKGKKF